MREIRFRAWNKRDKKLCYDICLYPNGVPCTDELEDDPYDYDSDSVQQFTGLKDKNGQEIYEGDIVISLNGEIQGIVKFQAPSFIVQMPRSKSWHEFILMPPQNQFQKIIGNIYENPELLK